jgi:hypothetical protein
MDALMSSQARMASLTASIAASAFRPVRSRSAAAFRGGALRACRGEQVTVSPPFPSFILPRVHRSGPIPGRMQQVPALAGTPASLAYPGWLAYVPIEQHKEAVRQRSWTHPAGTVPHRQVRWRGLMVSCPEGPDDPGQSGRMPCPSRKITGCSASSSPTWSPRPG